MTSPDEPAGPPLDLDAIEADLDAIEAHLAELDEQPADERPVAARVAHEQLAVSGADGA